MSIGIQAKAFINNLDTESLKSLIQSVSNHLGLSVSAASSDQAVSLMLTDNGSITIAWQPEEDGLSVNIESQTSIMGAGFHKLVVEFIDAVEDLADIKFEVEDDTDFYWQRDFQKLRTDHFELWLFKIVNLLSERRGECTDFMVNWDLSWGRPENIPSTIVTPFGRFSLDFLIDFMATKGVSAFADVFFPCPDEEIDWDRIAWFNAMYMLWVKCYFMPAFRSEEDAEINSEIINLIEQTIKSGKGFPIPKREYLKLCELSDHLPIDVSCVGDYISDYVIGFRKGNLTYNIGNVSYVIPGCFLSFEEDGSQGFWNGSENDSVIRITAFRTAEIHQDYILKEDEVVVKKDSIKNGRYVLTDMGVDKGSHIFQVQLITEGQVTLFTLSSAVGIEKADAMQSVVSFISQLSATKTEIIEKISKLHDADRHQEIVDMLSAFPEDELTDELKSLLARAYNNTEQYAKALPMLLEVRETQENTPNWNFRVGYSYFYLGDYVHSLEYFQKALEMTPEDEDTQWFVIQCQLHNSFTQRVNNFWQWFSKHSDEMDQLLKQKNKGIDRIRLLIEEGLSIIGEDVYYNIGGKNELTFCIESHTECHYLYPYLVASMPEELRQKWIVASCKQPVETKGFTFGMYGKNVDISEIRVSMEFFSDLNCFKLKYYHPELLSLSEAESIHAFYIILELIVGEGPVYNYVDEVLPTENSNGMFPIVELPTAMRFMIEENGKDYMVEPELTFCSYSCQPMEDEDRLRLDIICGSTQYMALNREYLEGESSIYDRLVSKGAQPLMLIMTQSEKMSVNEFLEFRYKVEDRLQELFDNSVVSGRILGGAYGTMNMAYIDLLLYDGPHFLDYLNNEETLDKLLALPDGTTCRTKLYYKDFKQDSEIFRLR